MKCPYCGGELEVRIESIHDVRPYEVRMDGEKDDSFVFVFTCNSDKVKIVMYKEGHVVPILPDESE